MNDRSVKKNPEAADVGVIAKRGDFVRLREMWESGNRFDLATVFERAVTDFRTVKRNDGHLQILKFCIDKQLDPMTRVDWMRQPLVCTAAMYGNAEIVDYIDSSVGLPKNEFVRASLGGVEFLQRRGKGSDVRPLSDCRDENQFSLLHYAVASGLGRVSDERQIQQETTCRFLIDSKTPTNLAVENEISLTPALFCAWFGGNPVVMQMLLDAGEINVHDLHQVVEFALEPHQRSGPSFAGVAEVILKNGFNINSIRPDQGRTLLHGCANRGSTAAVNWLLNNGADPNTADDQGRTSLHVAAIRNTHTSVVKQLIDHGANLATQDSQGNTALDLANENDRTKVVDYLASL